MKYYKLVILFHYLIFHSLETIGQNHIVDVEGHRGCRGLMPENSIPAFIKAIQLKVNTLEMDVVISSDKKVIISHEPWINENICLNKNGTELNLKDENELNIFKMDYDEIKKFDCGSKFNQSFPLQSKINTFKPLLSEVFDSVNSYCKSNMLPIPNFNIEIKSDIKYDDIFAPQPVEYCELVLSEIFKKSLQDHCILQSFDIRVLKFLHQKYPEIKLSYLSENINDFNAINDVLGFSPDIFSPNKEQVTQNLINSCHSKNIKIIPWTVNDEQQIKIFLHWGVDGIISDFPDKVIELM